MGVECGSLKHVCYTIGGLPDSTDVSQNQQTSVRKPTTLYHTSCALGKPMFVQKCGCGGKIKRYSDKCA